MAFALVAIALAASLFATAPADAKPVERELKSAPAERTDTTTTIGVKVRDDYRHGGVMCPAGTIAVAFEQPIYDDETGLFVVDYETVWYCLPIDAEPAG